MKKIILVIILLLTINVKAETITITSNTTIKDKEIVDNRDESNVIIVNNGSLEIKDSTLKKEGNVSDNVNNSFNNTALVVNDKSKLTCDKLEVNTKGDYAHGIYFKNNSESNIKNTKIITNNKFSMGIINDGANIVIDNSEIETHEHDSSGIYVINGSTEINDSKIITDAVDSPLLKVASKVEVNDTILKANNSEGIVGIPGANIELNKVELESRNINALSSKFKNIYFYNPTDSEESISFTSKNSKINTIIGNTFNVVNSNVTINLENNEINNTNGIFLESLVDENIESKNNINLNLVKQLIKGSVVLDKDATLNISLDNSEYIGAINPNNAAHEVNVTITKDSKLTLTGNIYVNSLTNGDYDNNNIDLNGYTLYINNEVMNKENIKHLNEKNDKMYIVLGFIIGAFLGYSVIYLYFRTKKKKK